jgi:hypothetical protein
MNSRSLLSSLVVAGTLAFGVNAASAVPMVSTNVIPLHQCLTAVTPAVACNGSVDSPLASLPLDLDVIGDGYATSTPITGATLTISLADDGGAGDGGEKVGVSAGGVTYLTNADANHDVVITLTDFTELFETGQLTLWLTASRGDFFVNGATLEVWSEPITVQQDEEQGVGGPTAVPAPGALALLFSAVAGFVVSRSRRG